MLTNVLQPTHLIIVLVVALLILGPKRLPDAGRALGQGIKEFKHSISGTNDDNAPLQITPNAENSGWPRGTTLTPGHGAEHESSNR